MHGYAMRETRSRATNWYVAHISGAGVAYAFWLRVEQERAEKGWSKTELAEAATRRATSGSRIHRPTIDNLRTSTRAPQPRIVNAIADALGIERAEAHQLAGIVDPPRGGSVSIREAIEQSGTMTDGQKQMLLDMVDALDAANAAKGRRSAS